MENTNLNQLVKKLNNVTSHSLESAVGLCASRTHYNVEIEHWLTTMLQNPGSELVTLLKHFNVDVAQLDNDLNIILGELKTGNTRTPSLSPNLVEWLHQAWSFASLELGLDSISTGTLLYALLKDSFLARQASQISKELKKIPVIDLQANFATIISTANENKVTSANNSLSQQIKNSALEQFTVDLTEQARQRKIDPVIGRDTEIRQIIDILMRRRQNNPILTGEAGVGKTAVVEGLALRITQKDVPAELQDVHIHVLDLALLQAGASVKGEFENRLKSVIAAVKQSIHPIILFIDEAHNLIGAGNQAGQGDAANLLKPALARGELRTIAATTWAEYKKFFEKDAALTRRFQVVKVEEPTEEVAVAIMRGLVKTLEEHHRVHILDEALIAAVRLSKRYLPSRQLPDKAVSVLDTACARVKLSQTTLPESIENCQRLLKQIADARVVLEREQLSGANHQAKLKELAHDEKEINEELVLLNTRWQEEKELLQKINHTQNQLMNLMDEAQRSPLIKELQSLKKLLNKNEQPLLQLNVSAQTIAEVLANWTGIPIGKMLSSEIDNILNLENELKKRVIGQDHAIQTITQSIQAARANLADPRKPIGVFLLLGSSGIGKTETALALADLLYGGKQNLITINMSEFKEEHKISMLTGSPAGYVGYGEGGLLTEAVRRRPYSIVLLDEMEKAHRGVQDIFYQVFDKGMLFDGEGREVDFKNTIILMTSNVGSETIIDHHKEHDLKKLKEELQPDLLKIFKPAFLSRTTLVPYLPLDEAILHEIIKQQMQQIEQRLVQNYNATLKYDEQIAQHIVRLCNQVEGGARNVQNLISNQLLPKLSVEILKKIGQGRKIKSAHVALDQDGSLVVDTH